MSITFLKKNAPAGLKVLSVIYYLATLFSILISVLAFTNSGPLNSIVKAGAGPSLNAANFASLGIIFFIMAAFSFLVALGLQNKNNIARIALIAFSCLNVIGGIISIIEGSYISSVNLAFNALVAYYLVFNKKVREEFITPL